MGFGDLAVKLKTLIEVLDETRAEETVVIAKEATILARLRIQQDKVDADGNPFGTYSQALVPQYYFYNRATSSGALDRIKKRDWFMSYEEFREDNNLPTDAIDFTFTGEMLRNVGVKSIDEGRSTVTVEIGGRTKESEEKLGYQSERFGNILELNEEEKELIASANRERVQKVINNILG